MKKSKNFFRSDGHGHYWAGSMRFTKVGFAAIGIIVGFVILLGVTS